VEPTIAAIALRPAFLLLIPKLIIVVHRHAR
jgi:hypothetical protein